MSAELKEDLVSDLYLSSKKVLYLLLATAPPIFFIIRMADATQGLPMWLGIVAVALLLLGLTVFLIPARLSAANIQLLVIVFVLAITGLVFGSLFHYYMRLIENVAFDTIAIVFSVGLVSAVSGSLAASRLSFGVFTSGLLLPISAYLVVFQYEIVYIGIGLLVFFFIPAAMMINRADNRRRVEFLGIKKASSGV